MVNAFKDAFERARRKSTGDSSSNVGKHELTPNQIQRQSLDTTTISESFENLLTASHVQLHREDARHRVKATDGSSVQPVNRRVKQQNAVVQTKVVAKSGPQSAASLPNQVVIKEPATPQGPAPAATVSVSKDASCKISLQDSKAAPLLSKIESVGRATQILVGKPEDKREVALGLDFGTSSVKVVIGDSALGKAFAVPFCKAVGIEKFLGVSEFLCARRLNVS